MEHKTTVTDLSLLTPWFTKNVVEPLFRFVPWWLPANIITIMSNFCIMVALVVTVLVTAGFFRLWLLVPLLILAYATGDCLDGKQARRTRTCSKLGEFLDHFLDIFVNGFLVSMHIIVFGIHDSALTALFLGISYLALSGFYFEQYHAKRLYFEKMGAFEAVIIFTVLLSLGLMENTRLFLQRDIFYQLSLIDLLQIAMALGAVYSLKRNLDRTGPSAGKGFAVFFLMTAVTAFSAAKLFQPAVIMFIITAYCGSFVGRLHIAYLLDQKEPSADMVFPAFLVFALVTGMPYAAAVTISLVYQTGSIFLAFLSGFMPLRKFWLWFNPGEEYVDAYTT